MEDTHEMGILSYLLMALLVLAVLLYFFRDTITIWDDKTEAELCRKSVEIHAMAHVKGISTIQDLKCPPSYEPIKSDTEKEIKEDIANSMAECFWKFGANELELFQGDTMSTNRFCALCHHITFEGDARGVNVNNFAEYLAKQPVPKKYDKNNIGMTYAHYIIGEPTDPSAVQAINAPKDASIDTTKDYGIVFIYTKYSYIHEVIGTIAGATAGGVIGLTGALYLLPFGVTQFSAVLLTTAIGAGAGYTVGSDKSADWQEAILLVPWDEQALSNLNCTYLPIPQGNK